MIQRVLAAAIPLLSSAVLCELKAVHARYIYDQLEQVELVAAFLVFSFLEVLQLLYPASRQTSW